MGLRSRKQRWFRVVALAFAAAAFLGIAELALRIQEAQTIGTQQIDAGLLVYDERLGWRLTPNWHGRHRYAGFDVTYSVDPSGFRSHRGSLASEENGRKKVLVIGDSFTFGIGVNDHETFVARLNEGTTNGLVYVNCGIPGFSTDQEVLLAEQELARRPDVAGILLAVCLGNDLLDNPRAFPMQTHLGKPCFRYEAGELSLTNTPVPRIPKLPSNAADELAKAIHGPAWHPDWATRVARKSAIARYIHRDVLRLRSSRIELLDQHLQELGLFWALVNRLGTEVRRKGAFLKVLLLPGRSAFLYPESGPGQYQRLIRDRLVADAKVYPWPIIDLLEPFREESKRANAGALFMADGHFSAEGSRLIAAAVGMD